MAMSNKERQSALRERRRLAGLEEVRGIYATKEDAVKIKAYAKSLKTK
jgi:hypothetical protein